MLNLLGSGSKLEVVTAGTITVDTKAEHVDFDPAAPDTATPGSTAANIASATTTTIADKASGATLSNGKCRNVTEAWIRNKHASAAATVTVQAVLGDTGSTTTVELYKVVLAAGEVLAYTEATGWFVALTVPTYKQAFVTATTSISAATYADITGATLDLEAGTWLVKGLIYGAAANLAFLMHGAITDGANAVVQEGSQFVPASGTASVNAWGALNLACVVAPGSTTTYKLRAARGLTTLTNTWAAQDGSGVNVTNNASSNSDKGTGIVAVKLR